MILIRNTHILTLMWVFFVCIHQLCRKLYDDVKLQ